jgi:hypothetical protein
VRHVIVRWHVQVVHGQPGMGGRQAYEKRISGAIEILVVGLPREDDDVLEAVLREQLAELHRGDQVADHPRQGVHDN